MSLASLVLLVLGVDVIVEVLRRRYIAALFSVGVAAILIVALILERGMAQ